MRTPDWLPVRAPYATVLASSAIGVLAPTSAPAGFLASDHRDGPVRFVAAASLSRAPDADADRARSSPQQAGSRGKPAPATSAAAPESHLSVEARFVRERPADTPPADSDAKRRLEQLGRLVHSDVTLEADEAPLRDVLKALRRAIGINLVVFELDRTGSSDRDGVDPEQPITISLTGVSGRSALEAIAALAGPSVTWQLTSDRVEFGPKSVLARAEARRTEVYETTDLALDPPDWKNPIGEAPGRKSYNRRDSDEIIGELVRNIAANCEPEAFFAPPPPMVETSDGRRLPTQHTVPTGSVSGGPPPGSGGYGSPRKRPNTLATVNYDPSEAVVFIIGQWASIQAKDNNLSVLAPDFVHRAIGGYPPPLAPRAAE